jgi:ABC-type uncharacterized transport system permease subunit
MNNNDLYEGNVNTHLHGKFIPQLNLFYDEDSNTYYNEYGQIASVNNTREEQVSLAPISLKKPALPLDVLLQVLALVLAAAAQYNVLENNITESENQLAIYKATTDEKFNNLSQLYKDMDILKQKQDDLLREIDELKFHNTSKR